MLLAQICLLDAMCVASVMNVDPDFMRHHIRICVVHAERQVGKNEKGR
jgi:hypothetical protein